MRGAAGSDNNTGGALKTCASQLYDVITGEFLSTYHYDPLQRRHAPEMEGALWHLC